MKLDIIILNIDKKSIRENIKSSYKRGEIRKWKEGTRERERGRERGEIERIHKDSRWAKHFFFSIMHYYVYSTVGATRTQRGEATEHSARQKIVCTRNVATRGTFQSLLLLLWNSVRVWERFFSIFAINVVGDCLCHTQSRTSPIRRHINCVFDFLLLSLSLMSLSRSFLN